jgi:hypothetical protein
MDVEYNPWESAAADSPSLPVNPPSRGNPVRQASLNQRENSYRDRQERLAKSQSNARPDGNWFVESHEDGLKISYAALLEFKAWKSINWERDWSARPLFTSNALRMQRQIRKYVVTYECPCVILWDGETLLLLHFGGTTAEELKSETCRVDYWVIEYSKSDGVGKPEMLAGLYWFLREAVLAVCPAVRDSSIH